MSSGGVGVQPLTREDYTRLLQFRAALRRFEHWSQQRATHAGLPAAQHQLLLTVIGHPGDRGPTITDVAGYLLVRHHSAVGLVDRAVRAGLLERRGDVDDGRVVRLGLTEVGQRAIAGLSAEHLVELTRLAPAWEQVIASLPATEDMTGALGGPRGAARLSDLAPARSDAR